MIKARNTSFRIKSNTGSKIIEYDRNKILDSVALQDHYSKILKLPKMPLGRKVLPSYHVRKVQQSRIQNEKSQAGDDLKKIKMDCAVKSRTDTNLKLPKKSRNSNRNKENDQKELNYMDVMNNKVEQLNVLEDNKREQKIVDYNKNLTLAQKRGLIKKPQMPLTPQEWSNVIKVANNRICSEMTCSICQEGFKIEKQVVLSCSHVFHKNCIDSFEKFSNSKNCPLCRAASYEKTDVYVGARFYIEKNATKIQATMRTYYVRTKFFNRMIQQEYKPKSVLLKRELLAYKLSCASDKYTRAFDKHSDQIRQLGKDMGKNKYNHDLLMADYIKNVERMALSNNHDKNPIKIIEKITLDKVEEDFEREANKGNYYLNDFWKKNFETAISRCEDCPICFTSHENGKPLYVTSCGHMFHAPCLASFETYSGANCKDHKCPVCRQKYEKKPILGIEKNQE